MRTLLVAGGGGHLEELWLLRPRLVGVAPEVTWVTPDSPQSRSLLVGEQVEPIPKSDPRDVRATLATTRRALELLGAGDWDSIVSTGSLPAVPFMALARARRIPCHFIESAARVAEPSLTARILERLPGVHRYAQHRHLESRRWHYRGSVLDGFVPTPRHQGPIAKVVVTTGSSRAGFRRMIEAVRDALPPGAEVLWQTGATDVHDLGIPARPFVPAAELAAAMAAADLVVAHAGVGSALMALQAGHRPLLLPRRRRHGEHVDDHQVEISRLLDVAGLAVAVEPAQLRPHHLDEAAATGVRRASGPEPFVLVTS